VCLGVVENKQQKTPPVGFVVFVGGVCGGCVCVSTTKQPFFCCGGVFCLLCGLCWGVFLGGGGGGGWVFSFF